MWEACLGAAPHRPGHGACSQPQRAHLLLHCGCHDAISECLAMRPALGYSTKAPAAAAWAVGMDRVACMPHMDMYHPFARIRPDSVE